MFGTDRSISNEHVLRPCARQPSDRAHCPAKYSTTSKSSPHVQVRVCVTEDVGGHAHVQALVGYTSCCPCGCLHQTSCMHVCTHKRVGRVPKAPIYPTCPLRRQQYDDEEVWKASVLHLLRYPCLRHGVRTAKAICRAWKRVSLGLGCDLARVFACEVCPPPCRGFLHRVTCGHWKDRQTQGYHNRQPPLAPCIQHHPQT